MVSVPVALLMAIAAEARLLLGTVSKLKADFKEKQNL
jgi:hypothetical protein